MSAGLVKNIFLNLPDSLKTVAASAKGAHLNWWRYGSDTEGFVEEALQRDSWSDAQWSEWSEERLSFILERAINDVPYYRDLQEVSELGNHSSLANRLTQWPILEKSELRKSSKDFVADDVSLWRMFRDHTGGTTGTAQDIWLKRETIHRQYALFEARVRRWNGLSRHDRWGMVGGQLILPFSRRKPPFWVWNAGMNQLYLSPYHLAEEFIPHYLDAINKYRVRYILGYPSALNTIARWILENKKEREISLDLIVTNSEPLYQYQRDVIEAAFGCRAVETYGMGEAVAAASECEKGSMHLWPEYGIVEVIDGEFICTGLLNADMPLIRYRVGDRGKISDARCECDRNLPIVESIEGRSDDVLFGADGREVGTIGPVFSKNLPILEAQVIQHRNRDLTVRYVPLKGFSESHGIELTNRLRERLGDLPVVLEKVRAIPRTSSGKFRAVVSEIGKSGKDAE
jgi:phenylacetate-CoA ligase